MIRNIEGLENAQIMRYAYAIEYDFAPPEQLHPSLETKAIEGLFFAGQINGTTGYEEAAGQGLLAAANAVRSLNGQDPLILGREEAYLGVMVDDLVTKGVDEPYRMFTSRAEHRLRLRGDNADRRLTEIGWNAGLVDAERWKIFREKMDAIEQLAAFLRESRVRLPAGGTISAEEYLRRPEVEWSEIAERFPQVKEFSLRVTEQVCWDIKYSGYLSRQDASVERARKLQKIRIPDDFDYFAINQLRMEAKEQLSRIRPQTIDQASRIRGITPADLAVLVLVLRKH